MTAELWAGRSSPRSDPGRRGRGARARRVVFAGLHRPRRVHPRATRRISTSSACGSPDASRRELPRRSPRRRGHDPAGVPSLAVREITADPFRWQRTLQVLADERLPVTEYPQIPSRMTPACSQFYEACIEGTLTHSGDTRLARHVANAVLRTDSRGARIVKESKHSDAASTSPSPPSWPTAVPSSWPAARRRASTSASARVRHSTVCLRGPAEARLDRGDQVPSAHRRQAPAQAWRGAVRSRGISPLLRLRAGEMA